MTLSNTSFKKLTPNLVVASVERSLAFYIDVLGFIRGVTVPEQSPFVFASVVSGTVEIFLNDRDTAIKEYPGFAGGPLGATATMFLALAGCRLARGPAMQSTLWTKTRQQVEVPARKAQTAPPRRSSRMPVDPAARARRAAVRASDCVRPADRSALRRGVRGRSESR